MRLQAFAGLWDLERDIEDVRAGRAGRFSGTARFAPVPDGLAYVEEGTLRLPGAPPMQATRRYQWRDGGAGTIEVWFEDGRLLPPLLRRRTRAGGGARMPARPVPRALRLRPLAALAGRMAGARPAQALRHREPVQPGGEGGLTMRHLARLAAVAALAGCAAPTQAPPPASKAPDRDGLLRQMQACLGEPEPAPPCAEVDRARGFVVIKDDDPAKPDAYLIVPATDVTGIEDPADRFARRWRISGATAGMSGGSACRAPPQDLGARDQLEGRAAPRISCTSTSPASCRRCATPWRGRRSARNGRRRPFVAFRGHAYNARKVAQSRTKPVPALRAPRRPRGHG